MPFEPLIPPGFANCRFRFSVVGLPNEMGFSFGLAPETGLPDHAGVLAAEAFYDIVLDSGAFLGSNWTIIGTTTYTNVPVAGMQVFEYSMGHAGAFSADSSPPNCALLVQKKTGLAGRKFRGRAYAPPFNVNDVDVNAAGSISGALAGSHTTLWEAWRLRMIDDGVPLVLFHHWDTADPSTQVDPTPITQLIVQARLATQRRRLR